MAVAATGSGGDTRAPSATAPASEMPGTTAEATAATTAVVTSTSATASSRIGRALATHNRQDVLRAAAYSSGGSTSGRISSGSTCTWGTCGIAASRMPNMVTSTGQGRLIFDATGIRTAVAKMTAATRPSCCKAITSEVACSPGRR